MRVGWLLLSETKVQIRAVGFVLALLIGATPVGAQEIYQERQGVLEKLVFRPQENQYEITVREQGGVKTFMVDNREVQLKIDAKLLKDPMTAKLAKEGPVVFYIEEQQPRIKKPFFSRVIILFTDVAQLKTFLTTP